MLVFVSLWFKDLNTGDHVEGFYSGKDTWNKHMNKAAMMPMDDALEIAWIYHGSYINWFDRNGRRRSEPCEQCA